ncbi:MAG: SRPBCC family protein [bacterium]|nr:hypothetical protein [Planctomycetota bacterium]HIL51557.1 hypothetical protein [Planctomycetota bacterium]
MKLAWSPLRCCLLLFCALVLLAGGGLWLAGDRLPEAWDVDVSQIIDAPQAEIHGYIEDLHRWPEWSASQEEFPDSSTTFEGPDNGVDAVMHTRAGGSEVRITITHSDPLRGVWFDELLAGRVASRGVILYSNQGRRTRVRWQNHGSLGTHALARLGNYFLEKSLAEGLKRNLTQLKRVVEAAQ